MLHRWGIASRVGALLSRRSLPLSLQQKKFILFTLLFFLVVSVLTNTYFLLFTEWHGECEWTPGLHPDFRGSLWSQLGGGLEESGTLAQSARERFTRGQQLATAGGDILGVSPLDDDLRWLDSDVARSVIERRTASGGSASSGSSSSSGSGSGSVHQQDALIYFFNSIMIGTAVIHLASMAHGVQVTVVLFVIGMIVAIFMEGLNLYSTFGVFGSSYQMWLGIDPHLLLFTMLPTLLAGDAMSIDTSVAKDVAGQCFYLASVGVVLSALIVAGFLMMYLDWSFLLSLTTGSILCATDPVAVVALLKELGASPVLTVQIQGESLLNDGTAIVLYTVAYEMLSGQEYDVADIALFLVKTAMMAIALGVLLGYFFFTWLRASCNRFNHHADVIQILLTFCAAYWSFVIAEGMLKMSGVLATVGSSLVLAHYMWPHIVSVHSMHNFWHTVETIGNILIFLLGGGLCGAAMVHIPPVNYLHLIVLYIFLTFVRGAFLFASMPVLKWLSPEKKPVSWEDAMVMCWGGLRGAVGLALAMQVNNGRARNSKGVPQITEEDARLVLFFVSGIAFLTTCINAMTAPRLVQYLGITQAPATQLRLMKKFNEQLVNLSVSEGNPQIVTEGIQHMLHEIEHHFSEDNSNKSGKVRETSVQIIEEHEASSFSNERVMANFRAAEERYDAFTEEEKLRSHEKLKDDILINKPGQFGKGVMNEVCDFLKEWPGFDVEMAIVVDRTFLNLVRGHYTKLMQSHDLRPGSNEALLLETSIRVGLSAVRGDLVDFPHVLKHAGEGEGDDDDSGQLFGQARRSLHDTSDEDHIVHEENTPFANFVEGQTFAYSMIAVIISGCLFVAVEEAVGKSGSPTVWLVIEIIFTVIFIVEFVLRIVHYRSLYWQDPWNTLDFSLTMISVLAVAVSIHHNGEEHANSRMLSLSRVFRVLRLLRIVKKFHVWLSSDQDIDPALDIQMSKIAIFRSFAFSHLQAQKDLMRYFSGNDIIDEQDEVEVGRCLLQSQTHVYSAWAEIISVQQSMGSELLDSVQNLREKKDITEGLKDFVETALADGAIGAKHAESILHTLHHQISNCLRNIHMATDGIVSKEGHHIITADDHHYHGNPEEGTESAVHGNGKGAQANGASNPSANGQVEGGSNLTDVTESTDEGSAMLRSRPSQGTEGKAELGQSATSAKKKPQKKFNTKSKESTKDKAADGKASPEKQLSLERQQSEKTSDTNSTDGKAVPKAGTGSTAEAPRTPAEAEATATE